MEQVHLSSRGPIVASLCAGPLFLAAYAGAVYVGEIPRPVALDASQIAAMGMIALPAIVVGFLLSFIPNFVAGTLMASLSEWSETVRIPVAWVAAGAAAGYGIAQAFAVSDPHVVFALVATSAACAAICRCYLRVD